MAYNETEWYDPETKHWLVYWKTWVERRKLDKISPSSRPCELLYLTLRVELGSRWKNSKTNRKVQKKEVTAVGKWFPPSPGQGGSEHGASFFGPETHFCI